MSQPPTASVSATATRMLTKNHRFTLLSPLSDFKRVGGGSAGGDMDGLVAQETADRGAQRKAETLQRRGRERKLDVGEVMLRDHGEPERVEQIPERPISVVQQRVRDLDRPGGPNDARQRPEPIAVLERDRIDVGFFDDLQHLEQDPGL